MDIACPRVTRKAASPEASVSYLWAAPREPQAS